MNTHLKQLWAAMKLPEKLQKSYKFFCRGLDIRVADVVDTSPFHSAFLASPFHRIIDIRFCEGEDSVRIFQIIKL